MWTFIFLFKIIQNKVKIIFYAMLWNVMLWYNEQASMRLNPSVWDSNSMVCGSNTMLWSDVCYTCKIYGWPDCTNNTSMAWKQLFDLNNFVHPNCLS